MEIESKQVVRISEVTDSIILELDGTGEYKGIYTYHLGKNEEIHRFIDKLLRGLALHNKVEFKIK